MHRTVHGANAIIALRCCRFNQRFEYFCEEPRGRLINPCPHFYVAHPGEDARNLLEKRPRRENRSAALFSILHGELAGDWHRRYHAEARNPRDTNGTPQYFSQRTDAVA